MKLSIGTYLQRGKYRIERVLGQGSFGITYLASVNLVGKLGTIRTDTKVAIKEFFMRDVNGRNEDTVTTGSKESIFYNYKRRFIKEAKTLSKLNHPNIVHVLDLFEENNTAYYVMEYLDGGSLDNLISSKNRLSADESKIIVNQIGSALEYMHSNRMLHLDLKPANVMINKAGQAVLIDFGLTKEFDSNGEPESSTTVGHGTPGYAPIEQSSYKSGQGFQATLDVYSLGATFYKMLTGKRPPEASEILNEGFDILHINEFDEKTVGIIKKALSPMRGQRYQSISELLENIEGASSTHTAIFPENTISMFIVMKNDAVIYYFRGKVYKDLNGSFVSEKYYSRTVSELKGIFAKYFEYCGDFSFGDFIFQYKQAIMQSYKVIATFLSTSDYFRLISSLKELQYKSVRIIRENSAIAEYLSSHHKGTDGERDVVYSIHYDHHDVGFLCSDGVIEIRNDYDELRKDSVSHTKGKKFGFNDVNNVKVSLLAGYLKHYYRIIDREKDSLLLDVTPFDIYFGPQWGSTIPKMIEVGTAIPTRKTETLDFVGTDYICVKILDRVHIIDVVAIFGYAPKEIECTVECQVSLQDIFFTIKDKVKNKERIYKIMDMQSLHYEAWKEPELT